MAMIIAALGNMVFSESTFSENGWKAAVQATDASALYDPHLRDGRYYNPWMPMPEKGFIDVMKWRFFTEKERFTDEEESFLPSVSINPISFIKSSGSSDFFMWIGHSTVLFRVSGICFILDPIFSDRAVVPKRATSPAVSIEELLALDVDFVVLLTHNHYDHLDKKSMEKFPKGTKVYAPKGLSNAINKMNGKVVHELDWWESADLGNGIRIHSVPAQHWSLRAFSGRNKTLWCSFVVETADGEIFAGGDSGYFKGFREIGRKFSNIRVAFLPIGASRPRWFMHYAHMDSSEMLLAATELGARSVLPIHWGAFKLGEEPAGYPGLEIRRIIENSDHGYRGNIFLPSLGEGVLVPQ